MATTRQFDYRSDGTKKRDALHEKIAKTYLVYRSNAPQNVRDAAIFKRIANEFSISDICVRNVCISKGVATPKRKSTKC